MTAQPASGSPSQAHQPQKNHFTSTATIDSNHNNSRNNIHGMDFLNHCSGSASKKQATRPKRTGRMHMTVPQLEPRVLHASPAAQL